MYLFVQVLQTQNNLADAELDDVDAKVLHLPKIVAQVACRNVLQHKVKVVFVLKTRLHFDYKFAFAAG